MRPGGIVMAVAGAWLISQLVAGNLLGRLGLFGASAGGDWWVGSGKGSGFSPNAPGAGGGGSGGGGGAW